MATVSDQLMPHLLQVFLDRKASPARRVAAASRLGDWNSTTALEALLRVAQTDDEDVSVSRAAGKSIADILIRRGEIDQVPLYDFNKDAFVAYDEAIGRHQQSR